MRVIGYIRVSTDEQADSGAGLAAQRLAIEAEATRRGWELVVVYDDSGVSAKSIKGRPGLTRALAAVESGEGDALVVAKLDRLSRSILDFAALMDRSQKKGWALIALDLGVDTSTPSGEMMANVLAVFAQFERRLIGQRTKDALSAKRAEGTLRGPIGRPRSLPSTVRRRIARDRAKGLSFGRIAERLNADGVATAQGGREWYPATVRKVLVGAGQ